MTLLTHVHEGTTYMVVVQRHEIFNERIMAAVVITELQGVGSCVRLDSS